MKPLLTGRAVNRWLSLAALLPAALALLLVLSAREAASVHDVVESQAAGARLLVQFGDARQQAHYKVATLLRQRPEVISLGGSRCAQFRARFLSRQPHAFYNACQLADTLQEASIVAKALARTDYRPRVILLAIDPWWFADSYRAGRGPRFELRHLEHGVPRALAAAHVFARELAPLLRNLAETRSLAAFDAPSIGLTARLREVGTRDDGSYRYDFSRIPEPGRRSAHALYRISRLESPFTPATSASSSALDELARLLEELRALAVDVIPFTAPLSPSTFSALQRSAAHGYLSGLEPILAQTCSEHGLRFRDFLDPGILEASEDRFIDGWHGSEWLMLRLYLQLAEGSTALGELSDGESLRARLARAPDPFRVFDE